MSIATLPVASSALMTSEEAAAYIGVKPQTISVWRTAGRYALPFVKVGRLVRYRKADLDRWLASRTATSSSAAE